MVPPRARATSHLRPAQPSDPPERPRLGSSSSPHQCPSTTGAHDRLGDQRPLSCAIAARALWLRRPAPTTPPPALGTPPDPDATASLLSSPTGSSRSARTTLAPTPPARRAAPDPVPAAPPADRRAIPASPLRAARHGPQDLSILQGQAGVLPSSSTTISSSWRRRRIQPASSSERPSNG